MRKYKQYIIPDRKPRTDDHITAKQKNYCIKSDCNDLSCEKCLFGADNRDIFIEWYLAKNKK